MKKDVHTILSHSYILYGTLFLVAFLAQSIWSISFDFSQLRSLGFVMMMLGPLLVYYAQHTTAKFSHRTDKTSLVYTDFAKGPYRFSRTPTHTGLLLLFLGYGLVTSSVFICLAALISFVIAKEFFIKHEEYLLCEKYGEPYREYCKKFGKIL